MPTPENKPVEYERVKIDEWIEGEIEEVEYEKEHAFTFQGQTNLKEAVRFRFRLNGYESPKRSRWMTFIYSERSNLYKKYVQPLVEDAMPFMTMPTEVFHNFKIKTMWDETPDSINPSKIYQHIEKIKPLEAKIPFNPEWKPLFVVPVKAGGGDTQKNTANETEDEPLPF